MLWLSFLIAFIVAFAIAWLVYRADKKRGSPYPWLTAMLRGIVFFLVIILLLAPRININSTDIRKPVIIFLQDNSQSVGIALGNDTGVYRKDATELIRKLSGKYVVVPWSLSGHTTADSLFEYQQPVSNIAKALDEATSVYDKQNLGAIILASDGRYNEGANPAYVSMPLSGGLYAMTIGDTSVIKDLRIAKVYANKTVSLNSQFEIRADIIASRCAGYQDNSSLLDASGKLLATGSSLHITGDQYDGTISFTVKADKPGLQRFSLVLPVADGEKNTANNKVSIFVEVIEEKKKILLLSAAPHPDINAIHEALKGIEQYDISISPAGSIPADLDIYQCIIAHQLPSFNNNNITARLINSGKNIWYIAGSLTNTEALNQLQQAAVLNGRNSMPVAAMPVFNNTFNAFTVPADIRAVTDKLPPLSVSAVNISIIPGSDVLFNQSTGQPLWLLKRGSKTSALLCGEGIWRWRLYEYRYFSRHDVVDECMRQTVNFLTADTKEKPFRVQLPKYVWNSREQVQVNAYLNNSNNEPVNDPEATISIRDSSGNSRKYTLERNGNAYKINTGAWPPGTYSYVATTVYNGKTYSDAGSFAVAYTSPEMQETGADYALMYAIARKNGGSTFTSKQFDALYDSIVHNEHIKPVITEKNELIPLADWKWYFFLIVIIAATEWLLRKYWLAM